MCSGRAPREVDLAAGDGRRGQEGGRLDPVGHHAVGAGREGSGLDAVDDQRRRPMPSIWAPMGLRKRQRSAISGSRAALSSTVVPLARTAAMRMFSVAPTLGNSRVMSAPRRSSARASR